MALALRDVNRLEHFPITFFATVMGVTGLSLAWRRAAKYLDAPTGVATGLAIAGSVLFIVVLGLYVTKVIRFRDAVRAELKHPIKLPFAATVTVSILLVATAWTPVSHAVATPLWWIGAIGHLAVTLVTMGAWIWRETKFEHVLPTWFIPIVGNIITPVAGAHIGSQMVSWFSLVVGLSFWVILLPIVIGRYVFLGHPKMVKLTPVIAIFVAPPAVGMVALQSMIKGSQIGVVGIIMMSLTALFAGIGVVQIDQFRKTPFGLPWWAITFPLDAIAVATITFVNFNAPAYAPLAWITLGVATTVIAGVALLTIRAIIRKEICVPEGPAPAH